MRRRQSVGESAYLVLVTLPILALLMILASGAYREYAAGERLHARLAGLANVAAAGTSAEHADSHVAFDRRLSKEHSIAWQDLLRASDLLSDRFASVDRSFMEEIGVTDALPGDPWVSEPMIREYTQQARPIIERMAELTRDDRPVWQPLIFEGFETLLPDLQRSRGLVNMLTAEFRHAVHQGDQQRAIEALRLILGVGDAFDWQIGIISDFIFFQHRSAHRTLIRSSLERDFWKDPESLEKLRQQLATPDDLDARWRQMIASERTMLLSELRLDRDNPQYDDPPLALFPFGVPPTVTSELLASMDSAAAVAGAGTLEHVRAIERKIDAEEKRGTETFTVTGIPFAIASSSLGLFHNNHESLAMVFAYEAMQRRWTMTAVALRQFRLQEGRWPEKLSELEAVGIGQSEWMMFAEQPFGYRVSEDGTEAVLWTIPSQNLQVWNATLPPSLPSETGARPEIVEATELRLR